MSIYREDLVGEERDFYIESANCINEYEKYKAMYEISCIKYDQMCKDAEFKVLQESGTYDDLAYLYIEAKNTANAEQEGFLKKAWDAICRFFAGLRDFIFGKNKDLPDNAVVELPENIQNVVDNISNVISAGGPAQMALKIGSIAAASGAGAFTLNKIYKKFSKRETVTLVDKACNYLTTKIGEIMSKIGQFADPVMDKKIPIIDKTPREIMSSFDDIIKNIGETIKTQYNKALSLFKRGDNNNQDPAVPQPANPQQSQGSQQPVSAQKNQRSLGDKVNAARNHLLNSPNNQNKRNDIRTDYQNNVSYRLDGNNQTLLKTATVNTPNGVKNIWRPVTAQELKEIPKGIRHTFGFESTDDDLVIDASQIREVLGDNYLVSVSEAGDYVDITFVGDDISEDVLNVSLDEEEISIQESVFGSDPAEEGMISEDGLDYDDNELNELLSLLD